MGQEVETRFKPQPTTLSHFCFLSSEIWNRFFLIKQASLKQLGNVELLLFVLSFGIIPAGP